jgi:glycosyltransferase involved in cell wall biosynthesis
MVIGIAMYTANTTERTGVAWYVFHLVKQLALLCPSGVILRLYVDRPLVADFFPLPDCVEVRVLRHPLRYAWTHTRLVYELWRHPVDVLFVPSHVLPVYYAKKSKIPMVMTIHDVAAMHVPKTYSLLQRMYTVSSTFYAMLMARAVIVPSHATKQDIVQLTSVDPKCADTPIHVIPLAVDMQQHQTLSLERVKAVLSELCITAPYFLFVGRLESKKNVQGILHAYDAFRRLNTSRVQLVLVGKCGVGFEEIEQLFQNHPYKNDIIFKEGWIEQEKVQALYTGATACIYPSLYEGFGLNVLDSLSYGVPVIVSDSGSLSELGGDCVVRVSAQNIEAIAQAMSTVCTDTAFLTRVKQDGPAYAKTFTWRQTVQQTLQVLMDVIS